MQTIVIAGKLGKDAETRSTNNGDSVTSFSVAVDQRNGRDKTPNWFRCSLWGKRGESLAQYLTKGSSVTVSGEFSLGEYDGKPQLNVRVNEVALQGGAENRSNGGQSGGNAGRSGGDQTGNGGGAGGRPNSDDLDDDIPFVTSVSIW